MTTNDTPAAALHRRMKILKPVTYAREELAPGQVVMIDAATAATWIRDQIAVETDEPMPCWRCGELTVGRKAQTNVSSRGAG